MTSRCRYPQKLLEYKTCYYVIITSHSVVLHSSIKMQNLNHENLSFTVTLAVESKGQKSETQQFRRPQAKTEKVPFSAKIRTGTNIQN